MLHVSLMHSAELRLCVFCNFAAGTQSRCQSRLLWFKRLRHESELALQHLLRRDSGSRQEWGLWESLKTSSFAESIIKGKPWLACHMGILILQKFKILNLACCQIVPICSLISEQNNKFKKKNYAPSICISCKCQRINGCTKYSLANCNA